MLGILVCGNFYFTSDIIILNLKSDVLSRILSRLINFVYAKAKFVHFFLICLFLECKKDFWQWKISMNVGVKVGMGDGFPVGVVVGEILGLEVGAIVGVSVGVKVGAEYKFFKDFCCNFFSKLGVG